MVRALAMFGNTYRVIALAAFFSLDCNQHQAPTPGPQPDIRAGYTYDEKWDTPVPAGVQQWVTEYRDSLQRIPARGPMYVRLRAGKCFECLIQVTIRTLVDTRTIDPTLLPPAGGEAIAELKNLDDKVTEAYYGLKPAKKARYFLWADTNPSTTVTRITVIELPTVGPVTAGLQKDLVVCSKYPHDGSPSEGVDFLEYRHPEGCHPPVANPAVTRADLSFLSDGLMRFVVDPVLRVFTHNTMISGGGWIDCNSGCCT